MEEILMKKAVVLLLAVLMLGTLAVPNFGAGTYSEKVEQEYIVHWDGSADLKFTTALYGPPDLLNSTKESLSEIGIDNATNMMVNQRIKTFSQLGMNLVNASGTVKGYDSDGPLITEITGKVLNFAKYYSYDGVWEITLDVLRVSQLSQVDVTSLNQTFDFEDYYSIILPEGAEILNVPSSYSMESGKSSISLKVDVSGNEIHVNVHMHFDEGITKEDLQKLYGEFQPFVIQYKGKPGPEGNYSIWGSRTETNITVGKDETVIDTLNEYITPEDYVNYLKLMVAYQGEDTIIESMHQSYLQTFQEQGIEVRDWNITFENLNSPGPLKIRLHWVLTNYTQALNNTYTHDPSLGLSNISLQGRLNGGINQTVVIRITLPQHSEFTQLPEDIDVEANGSRITMKVTKVSENEVTIESSAYIRYGMLAKDYFAMMEKLPPKAEVKYTVGEEKTGTCGPALLLGLAIVPLLLRRRK
ncbi:MAG: hypothetical protein PWQ79_892 [Thermococcaceae archaeon]|nr:hypothetical protein [Thermococcaceae archaeon]MDK2913977.1 hypothetical protein [Thermococcaceae archaeon]